MNVSLSFSAPAYHFGFVCGVSLVGRKKLIEVVICIEREILGYTYDRYSILNIYIYRDIDICLHCLLNWHTEYVIIVYIYI